MDNQALPSSSAVDNEGISIAASIAVFFRNGACLCRPLSPGAYSIAAGCPRHDEPAKHPTHFSCICLVYEGVNCLACSENLIRGLALSGLSIRGKVAMKKKGTP